MYNPIIQEVFEVYREKSVLSKLILPVLMILMLLSLTGCGSKPNDAGSTSAGSAPTNSQNTKTGNSSAAGAITYENYLKIQLDSTYDDVKKILEEGKKTDISPDVVSYNWGGSGKTINIQISKGKVDSKTQTMLGKTTTTLTVDQFNKVTKGMTFDQVVTILGPDYQESSYKKTANTVRRVVTWMRPDSANVTIVLEDNKVLSQYNFLK